ncbi:MAG TPA: sulfatase-like hydrolase/transferase, partial [Longimicrobium sp.]|nr:sulfatase-like hydrolase/transferase [Longimicrobium sp.]
MPTPPLTRAGGDARTVLVFGLVLAGYLTAAALQSASQPGAARPNVVLIVADDLGYGDLGVYGATDVKTPNLDRLAGEGVRLTDFYANAPVCTPTRAGLITGRYQQRAMLERPLSSTGADLEAGLPATGRSLPRLMADAGYDTALIGKWHLGYKPAFAPRAHGFGYFWGYLSGYIDWYTHVRGDGAPDLWENEGPATHTGYFHHETTRRAIAFIEQPRAKPFFLDLSYGAPHWPFQSPAKPSVAARENNSMMQHPSDEGAPTRAAYVEIMEDFDREIGRVLEALKARGLDRNTLVVFMSDNGGEWLSRNEPLFNRKDTVWEGGIRVPAILRWPGVLPAGRGSGQVGITMDITASLIAAAGIVRSDLGLEGVDLVSMLASERSASRDLFWRVIRPDTRQKAMRSGDYKYLEDGGLRFLFNVRTDPAERNDLAKTEPSRAAVMRARVEAW